MFILQIEEDTVPFTDLTLPGVHWENVNRLGKYTSYTNYAQVIKQERLPSIFPSPTMVRETSYTCWFHCHFLSHDTHHFLSHDTSLPVT